MSAYNQPNLQHFHVFVAKLLCYFLIVTYFEVRPVIFSGWKQRLATLTLLSFQYNCTWSAICNWPSSAKNSKAKSSAVAQCSMTSMRALLSILFLWCPKQKENLEACRKTNGNLSAAFSEPLSWGSNLSVGRRRAFHLFLLPLSSHSFSFVQGFLHGTAMNGLECVYLGCLQRT